MPTDLISSIKCVERAAVHAQDYLSTIDERSVAPTQNALIALEAFDEALPSDKTNPLNTIDLLHQFGSPATTASTAGRFYDLVVGGSLPAALGARIISSAWDQIVFNDATSAICVKLEQVAKQWLLDILCLPSTSSVSFVSGATMGNFTCLAAARNALLKRQSWHVKEQGLRGAPSIRIVASQQIHVTVIKALNLLGYGRSEIEWAKCDGQGRIDLKEFPQTDQNTLVLTQSGNVNSGASDPIGRIVDIANSAWVHVDGAFGLWAAATPSLKHQLEGFERADSWVTDGHKWLNTPYDCGMAICRHPIAVHEAMATQAPYLMTGRNAAPKDMGPEFSRSARGVEVWAALRSLGRSGVAEMIETCCDHARTLASGLKEQGFEILNDVVLNQVVATRTGFEKDMGAFAAEMRQTGISWFGATEWQGRRAIRFSISNWSTTRSDIEQTLRAINQNISKFQANDHS